MPGRARGVPDPAAYGDVTDLPADLVDYVVQEHRARRAGLHSDVRFGTPDTRLFSWAVPRGVPEPGGKHLAIRQPLHAHRYKDWEGTIPAGYGAGEVSTKDKGQVLVTHTGPDEVHYTVAHGEPAQFVLRGTGYGRGGRNWLLMNTTPTGPVAPAHQGPDEDNDVNTNLLDGTLKEAADTLARRAAEMRSRPPTVLEKRAVGVSDVLTSLGQQLKTNPSLQYALLGGGVGGLLGAGSAVLGNRGKDPEERRGVLGSALTGALAGGALGGGAGLAQKYLGEMNKGQGLTPGEAMHPGEFTDPESGKKMNIDPEALRKDPSVVEKARALAAPPGPVEQGVMGTGSALMNVGARAVPPVNWALSRLGLLPGGGKIPVADKYAPVSSQVLPAVGLADLLFHAPRLNAGRWGFGRVDPRTSTNPDYLRGGMAAIGGDRQVPASVQEAILRNTPNQWREGAGPLQPGQARHLEHGDVHAYGDRPGDTRSVSDILAEGAARGGRSADPVMRVISRPEGKEKIRDTIGRGTPNEIVTEREAPFLRDPVEAVLRRGTQRDASHAGWLAAEKDLGHAAPRDLLRVGSHEFHGLGRGAGIAARLGLYAGLPLAEYTINSYLEENQKRTALRDLMHQVARPAPGG